MDNDRTLAVDVIVLATGYKVQIDQVPFLARGEYPGQTGNAQWLSTLDEHFQTNIPGLFITSMPATQNFGPFFAFTVAVGTSAKMIGRAIVGR